MPGEERSDALPRDDGDAMLVKESDGTRSHSIFRGKKKHVTPLLVIELSLAQGVVANLGPVKTSFRDHHIFSLFVAGRGPRRNDHAVQILFKIESRRAHKIRVLLIGYGDGTLVRPVLIKEGGAHRGEIQIDQRRRSR